MSVIKLRGQLQFKRYRRNCARGFRQSLRKHFSPIMKIIFLSAVCLLLDSVKGEECVDTNTTVHAFLSDTPDHKEFFFIKLVDKTSGWACIDYAQRNSSRQGCRDGPKAMEHQLCSFLNDSVSVSLTNHGKVNKVEMMLDCPYVLTITTNEEKIQCDFTSPSIAFTRDGSVMHIRNETFYPVPKVNITDVHGGYRVNWNSPTVSETLMQNLTFYTEVFDIHDNHNLTEYKAKAKERSFFIPIKDNSTIHLKAYFVDNFNRRDLPYNATGFTEPAVILKVSMIVLAVALIGLVWYGWRRKSSQNKLIEKINITNDVQLRNERHNPMYFHQNKEIKPEELEFVKKLGEGHFGEVCLMKWKTVDKLVAVKKLKRLVESETERLQYANEIEIFEKVGSHPNIVEMLGFNKEERPWFIVMEFVPLGDLLAYLRQLRFQFDESRRAHRVSDYGDNYFGSNEIESFPLNTPRPNCILPNKDMESFGRQIALGMEHLERCNVVHRDLAARNILLTCDKIIKITDFGLSRDSSYVNFRKAEMPLKWMAPETFTPFGTKCLSKSDVWSFGVVLWEIGTLGGSPYEGLTPVQLTVFLNSGQRLEKPETVKDSLYALMLRCWEYDYRNRPSFKEIVAEFDEMAVYFELSDLGPDYTFPPV